MYPAAAAHDALIEIFPNVYYLHGSINIGPGMRMNRNMVVVKHADELTLINPVRVNDSELAKLDALGTVKHVIRLGDFHGLDDRFYVDRYQANFWCQAGQATYKEPIANTVIDANSVPPFNRAEFFIFEQAKYPEAAIFLHDSKLLITCDSIQYLNDWSYTSSFTKFFLRLVGFRLGLNIGTPWLKRVTPKGGSLASDFQRLQQLDFNHLVAAHGGLLLDTAKPQLKEQMRKHGLLTAVVG